jgi:hypothetical protein
MILNKEASTKLIFKKFLNSHLLKEHDLRLENGKKNKIMLVNFPDKKYPEDLFIEDLLPDVRKG